MNKIPPNNYPKKGQEWHGGLYKETVTIFSIHRPTNWGVTGIENWWRLWEVKFAPLDHAPESLTYTTYSMQIDVFLNNFKLCERKS